MIKNTTVTVSCATMLHVAYDRTVTQYAGNLAIQ